MELSRVLLVGEMNPYGSAPQFALYCEPSQSAGGRMQRLVCALPEGDYLAMKRVNLCAGRWSMPAARAAAAKLWEVQDVDVLVLLGRKVATAFGLDWPAFASALGGPVYAPKRVAVLPHPSGLCRAWNEPGAFERARGVLRKVAPSVPWGSLS